LFRSLRRRVWRLDGNETSGGEPLSVLCAAPGQTRRYLTELLFDADARESDLGQHWLWNLCRAGWARRQGCSLVLIQTDPVVRRLLTRDRWFLIPLWVIGRATLPVPDTVFKGKSIRTDLRVMDKSGLHGRVTKDPALFDDFYHTMYVPHVTKAHGSSVYVTPYDEIQERLADSELVLIRDGERDVAGMVIVYDEERPRLWCLGVRDGDRQHLKNGALTALYHFSVRHLTEKGFASVNLGLSRAFLNDGVLRYKRKWAQKLVGTAPAKIALRVAAVTPGSTAFLRNNPFIFEKSGKLYAGAFLAENDPVTASTVPTLKRQYLHDGLSRLILFVPHGGTAPQGLELPPDVAIEPSPFRTS
jgi:hypothetical protein